jgi:hypothetical protein
MLAAAPSLWLWLAWVLRSHGVPVARHDEYLILLMATLGPYLAMVAIGLAKAIPDNRHITAALAYLLAAIALFHLVFVLIAWFLIVPALLLGGWTAHWIYQRRMGGRFMP